MKIKKVTDNVGYILGGVNMGVITNNHEAVLIDTGLDKDNGRKTLRVLEEEELELKAIINTHSHADHFGGNAYLTRNTDTKVYAPSLESGIIQNPLLEPVYLFHGANPISNLRNKFVLADASPVDHILVPGKLSIIGLALEVIPLPGHSFNQVGVQIDDILFCADTVFSRRVIEKYKIPVVQDVGNHLKTLEKLKNMEHRLFVPAHTKPTDDLSELIDLNMETTYSLLTDIKKILDVPKTTEDVQSELGAEYGIDLSVVQQYYLIHMTLMAYLGYLYDSKQADIKIRDNRLYWSILDG
ncbi:MBL fold metallo-hydrolase [Candidatus Bathyarchaeota archaeon]|nr:MBL fold metallo-hydrolase [Candidatus Bathyarchaeota archaeon]